MVQAGPKKVRNWPKSPLVARFWKGRIKDYGYHCGPLLLLLEVATYLEIYGWQIGNEVGLKLGICRIMVFVK